VQASPSGTVFWARQLVGTHGWVASTM